MHTVRVPRSVPAHLIKIHPRLWRVVDSAGWKSLDDHTLHIVVGSSFVDPSDPTGPLGNPIAVVIGEQVVNLAPADRLAISRQVNTPETVFINSCTLHEGRYAVNLTVYTPAGSEMGACAHGFLGALQTLVQTGSIAKGSAVTITTTIATSAQASISNNGVILLEFQAVSPRKLSVDSHVLTDIYGIPLESFENHGVLSVGSPKLTIEVLPKDFDNIRHNLAKINYRALLRFQDDHKINGVHLFCRNPNSRLPEKCIQNNAYSGPENLADRATGVSNAAQISSDENVAVGQMLKITQYSFDGPSAVLVLTKLADRKVMVGGAVALFNLAVCP